MSDANHFSNKQQINPYYRYESININRAIAEHTALRDLLTKSGIKVITTESPFDSQDGVYTANWALVRGDKAILSRLPESRRSEEDFAERILLELGKRVIKVPEGLKFSGQGDALACGKWLFCGKGYRSDEAAQKFAAEKLGYERIQLQTVPQLDSDGKEIINAVTGWPDSFFYDIDLALAVIKNPTLYQKGLIAYCPEAFTAESREVLEKFDAVNKIKVSFDETRNGFATNLVSTGDTVIMSASAPEFAKELQQHGLKVIMPEMYEIAKGGGYIRCTTLSID
jgi:N-dimethylarginine dimethylaminohydrolase